MVPAQYRSSDDESSDGDSVKVGIGIGGWEFDVPQTTGEESDPDMSDLWVVEDSALATERRGRKYSLLRYTYTPTYPHTHPTHTHTHTHIYICTRMQCT